MAQKWHQKATVQAALVGGVFLVIGTIIGNYVSNSKDELNHLRDQLQTYKFSEELYKKIPGDVDFIARHLRIDKKEGSQVRVLGPNPGYDLRIGVTKLEPIGHTKEGNQQYAVRFSVSGVEGNNLIPETGGPLIKMQRYALAGPISAGNYEFYLFVDDVDIDYVYVSVARRKLKSVSFSVTVLPFGSVHIDEERPEPILVITDSPNG